MNLVVGEGLVLLIHNQSPCGSKNGVSDACRTGASVVGGDLARRNDYSTI